MRRWGQLMLQHLQWPLSVAKGWGQVGLPVGAPMITYETAQFGDILGSTGLLGCNVGVDGELGDLVCFNILFFLRCGQWKESRDALGEQIATIGVDLGDTQVA